MVYRLIKSRNGEPSYRCITPACAAPAEVQSLCLRWAVEGAAGAQEVEHAVDAVLGRALAVAAVQLLVGVVVAGDVPALDAHHRARLRRRRQRLADLTQHDEP